MPNEPMGPVIVGVDGSPESLAAVDLAAEEAVGRVTPLLVLHASPLGERPRYELVDAAIARARGEHPGLSVAGDVVTGEPALALLARSGDACLAVVGHRGRCRNNGHTNGSVAIEMISRAQVPVIVHRRLDPAEPGVQVPRPVLVGMVGPEPDAVLAFAFAEALIRGTSVSAMYVWSDQEQPDHHGVARGGSAKVQPERLLRDTLARWSDKYPEVEVEAVVRRGMDATFALTAASRSAQLIVVGSSYPGTQASFAHSLVHRAGCPVAVINQIR